MRIFRIFVRVYVTEIEEAIGFYEKLVGVRYDMRFKYDEFRLELAVVGEVLLIAGREEDLAPFRNRASTFLVDSVAEFARALPTMGATVLVAPRRVPTGKNMLVRHPDGVVVEYVEHAGKAP